MTWKRLSLRDSAEDIRNKLETLSGDNRLDKANIRGLDEIEKSVKEIGSRRIQTPAKAYRIHIKDCSSQCDGANKTFLLGNTHFGIVGVYGTDFPVNFRPVIDYIEEARGITLTSAVPAPSQGATLVIQFLK